MFAVIKKSSFVMINYFNRRRGGSKVKTVIGTSIPFGKVAPLPPAVVTLNSSLGYEPAYRIDRVKQRSSAYFKQIVV